MRILYSVSLSTCLSFCLVHALPLPMHAKRPTLRCWCGCCDVIGVGLRVVVVDDVVAVCAAISMVFSRSVLVRCVWSSFFYFGCVVHLSQMQSPRNKFTPCTVYVCMRDGNPYISRICISGDCDLSLSVSCLWFYAHIARLDLCAHTFAGSSVVGGSSVTPKPPPKKHTHTGRHRESRPEGETLN